MTTEQDLARLERQVLGVARVRGFLDSVAELRRLLAAESPDIRRKVLALTAPSLGRDLAAAVASAFDIGVTSAAKVIGSGAKVPTAVAPRGLTKAALGTQAEVRDALAIAKKLARAGAEPDAVLAPVFAAANTLERNVVTLVNQGGNEGSSATADLNDVATVWVAETNACVECLAYSGRVSQPGKPFPAGLTYGKRARSRRSGDVRMPPLHPNCRCLVEPLNDREYAQALRREADRSVLRGFSLKSESMSVRVDAAERLLAKGVDAPKSVIAYAQKAVKAGEFPTRGRPNQ